MKLKIKVTQDFLENIVDTLNELSDDSEEAGYSVRADLGRELAEKLRGEIVKAAFGGSRERI